MRRRHFGKSRRAIVGFADFNNCDDHWRRYSSRTKYLRCAPRGPSH